MKQLQEEADEKRNFEEERFVRLVRVHTTTLKTRNPLLLIIEYLLS